jgi:hypothetical protein
MKGSTGFQVAAIIRIQFKALNALKKGIYIHND